MRTNTRARGDSCAAKGTSSCRELTGLHLTTSEGIEQLMTSGTSEDACFPAVAAAYRIAVEILREQELGERTA
ncbi:MAG: hypothetical protein GF405_03180 [Candidatus Eisenbacteria bacterium]|nr:hypothetical protein [Candidatus Eisenbacteria bacterium]